jgi:hypothetical protein
LLVAPACWDATFVAGFKAWLKLGYCPVKDPKRSGSERFGGYTTDEVGLGPEPFDARHHWSGSSRSIWSESLSALGALEEVERSRRETVVLSDRRRPASRTVRERNPGGGVGSGRWCS